eukprot:c11983_g1_i1 orf=277-1941(+)
MNPRDMFTQGNGECSTAECRIGNPSSAKSNLRTRWASSRMRRNFWSRVLRSLRHHFHRRWKLSNKQLQKQTDCDELHYCPDKEVPEMSVSWTAALVLPGAPNQCLLCSDDGFVVDSKCEAENVRQLLDAQGITPQQEDLNGRLCRKALEHELYKSQRLNSWKFPNGQVCPTTLRQTCEKKERVRKWRCLKELQQLVLQLELGNKELQWKAASEIEWIAREGSVASVTLVMLGVISPIIALLESPRLDLQIIALSALLNLANGYNLHKSLIVRQGAIPSLVKLLKDSNIDMQERVVMVFCSLLDVVANAPLIVASGALPCIVKLLDIGSFQGRKDSVDTIYKISQHPGNVLAIIDERAVPSLLRMLDELYTAERALATLSNLARTENGRKALSTSTGFPEKLIDILGWAGEPGCQELASYLLLIVAHHSWPQRQTMLQAGAIPSLLELALLGTPLAQKRALRILNCLRQDRDWIPKSISGPLVSRTAVERMQDDQQLYLGSMQKHKNVVKKMVKQSLELNMERIIRRANLPSMDAAIPADVRTLGSSSSSKSLPF